MKIQLFKSARNRQWYFRFVSRNNRVMAQSEGYKRRQSAAKTALRIVKLAQKNIIPFVAVFEK